MRCFFCNEQIHGDGKDLEFRPGVCCNHCHMRVVTPYLNRLKDLETPKVLLTYMDGEPQMKKGLKGDIVSIDDAGQIHVRWENGSSLALNVERDIFKIL